MAAKNKFQNRNKNDLSTGNTTLKNINKIAIPTALISLLTKDCRDSIPALIIRTNCTFRK